MSFLAAAAPLLSLAGTAVSAFGSVEQGAYSGQVADNNAKVAKQNAEYSLEAGEQQADTESRKGAAAGAHLKAQQAASGVDVNTGSAVDVQAGERETNKLDAETVFQNAQLQAYGYTTQATNYEAQSKQDVTAGIIGGASSLLENASQLGPKWGIGSSTGGGTTTSSAFPSGYGGGPY